MLLSRYDNHWSDFVQTLCYNTLAHLPHLLYTLYETALRN